MLIKLSAILVVIFLGTIRAQNLDNCTCVPYYECKYSMTVGAGDFIDIRPNKNACENSLDTCCNLQDKITPQRCGYRNPEGVGFRIADIDGQAQFGEFPWMVAILSEETIKSIPDKLKIYKCGGSLIHPQAVLTAAHCVSDKDKKFKIRAGEWDTQTKGELYPHQDMDVKNIILHPQYLNGTLFNDVAILILSKPVELAENINVVCLPQQDLVVENTRCFASGWGKDASGKHQVILKKIDLPIVNRNTCQENLRKTRLGKLFELHHSYICAGGEAGKGTCKGDDGSPLVCPISGYKNRYYQAGIVSWGVGCGEDRVPGIYANLPLFRDWIDEQMTSNNFDMSLYNY